MAPLYKFTHLHRDGATIQVHSLTQWWCPCTNLRIYTKMVPPYKFTHLHNDGATVQVYSFTQWWRPCTSLLIYTEMAPLYRFTYLHRDGTTIQIYSLTQWWHPCTSLLIYTERAPLYRFTDLPRGRHCTSLLIYTMMAPLWTVYERPDLIHGRSDWTKHQETQNYCFPSFFEFSNAQFHGCANIVSVAFGCFSPSRFSHFHYNAMRKAITQSHLFNQVTHMNQ